VPLCAEKGLPRGLKSAREGQINDLAADLKVGTTTEICARHGGAAYRARSQAIVEPNPVLPVNEVYPQVDSTVNAAVCLKGFEDERMQTSAVSAVIRIARPVRIAIGSLTTRLNMPVVRFRLSLSSSDLT